MHPHFNLVTLLALSGGWGSMVLYKTICPMIDEKTDNEWKLTVFYTILIKMYNVYTNISDIRTVFKLLSHHYSHQLLLLSHNYLE